MKRFYLFLLTIVVATCLHCQPMLRNARIFSEGSVSPVTNINRGSYPRLLKTTA